MSCQLFFWNFPLPPPIPPQSRDRGGGDICRICCPVIAQICRLLAGWLYKCYAPGLSPRLHLSLDTFYQSSHVWCQLSISVCTELQNDYKDIFKWVKITLNTHRNLLWGTHRLVYTEEIIWTPSSFPLLVNLVFPGWNAVVITGKFPP